MHCSFVKRNVTPRMLPHSSGTDLPEHGADSRVFEELHGHLNIGPLKVYTRVTGIGLRDIFQKFHLRP